MPPRRTYAIVNPAAGGGRCGRLAVSTVQSLRGAGLEVEVVETRRRGEATALARAAYRRGIRDFTAVGGDGTGYEIINGLFGDPTLVVDPTLTLGFLPLGTGNSFLRDFSDDAEGHALRCIVEGRERPCDVVRLTHSEGLLHYINILSFGFVADVNGARQRRFSRFGEAGYVFAVLSEVAGLRAMTFPMREDEGSLDESPTLFVSFCNSRFTGGKMMMAPTADPSDGLVDLIRIGPLGRLALIREFPKIFRGTHVRNPACHVAKLRSVEFEIRVPIDIMIDGEADHVLPRRLDVLPSALRVRA